MVDGDRHDDVDKTGFDITGQSAARGGGGGAASRMANHAAMPRCVAMVREARPDLVLVAAADGALSNREFLAKLDPHAEVLDKQETLVFDHIKFGVRDFALSKTFYLQALEPIGVTVVTDWPPNGAELSQPTGTSSLCLYQTEEKPAHLHIAFVAESRHQVDLFYSAALGAGGQDNGPPGLRAQYSGRYYAAFVLDPDGHNIEVVCHEPPRHEELLRPADRQG